MLVESIECTYITVVVSLTMFIQDIVFLISTFTCVYTTYTVVYDVFVLGVSKRAYFRRIRICVFDLWLQCQLALALAPRRLRANANYCISVYIYRV